MYILRSIIAFIHLYLRLYLALTTVPKLPFPSTHHLDWQSRPFCNNFPRTGLSTDGTSCTCATSLYSFVLSSLKNTSFLRFCAEKPPYLDCPVIVGDSGKLWLLCASLLGGVTNLQNREFIFLSHFTPLSNY